MTYVYFHGQPVSKIEGNALYFYHNDHLGTPMMMTDQNRNIVWQAEHLPFGEPQSITGTITNNLRFAGQYYDAETGLHYNYFRDCMPEIGRYIEKDPIRFESGDVNFYAYVKNRPTVLVDPLSLAGCGAFGMSISDGWGLGQCCNDHDDCYMDCKGKAECDKKFCECMKRKCSLFDPSDRGACNCRALISTSEDFALKAVFYRRRMVGTEQRFPTKDSAPLSCSECLETSQVISYLPSCGSFQYVE